jgi:RNA polymerase primary sigma factor
MVATSVRQSLLSGNEPSACDDFKNENFQRSYLGAPAPKELSRRTFRTLLRWSQEGNAAIEKLLMHNTGLVMLIAGRLCRQGSNREDYLMEGMLGLRRAILRYDRRFECKLSTFAPHWIRHALFRYEQNHDRLVRLPVHALEKRKAVHDAERLILEKTRKDGGRGEHALVADIAKRTKLKPEMVLTLLHANNRTISTDHPVREEIGGTFGDLLTDDRPSPEERLSLTDMLAKIEAGMEVVLTGRERHVIRERYFDDGRTLEEIGVDFGVCRERIRQIEAEALSKLIAYFDQLDTL